jgi:hypothetical protein
MCVAQFLIKIIAASVLDNAAERICAEVFINIEQSNGLHQWTQDNLLMIREVELLRNEYY